MAKVLFFFTSCYPFGTGETFIENEIEYLAEAFDKIVIVSNDTLNKITRQTPKKTILYRLSYELPHLQKLMAIKNIGSQLFWQEFRIIKHTYKQKLSKGAFNTICQTLQKAKFWYPKIKTIITSETSTSDSAFLYSYWNNDVAFTLAHYKQKNPKVKAFSRMHGWDVYFEANSLNYLPFRTFLFQNLDRAFSISKKGKNYYNEWFPELKEKIQVSYLGTAHHGKNPINTTSILQILTLSNTIAIKNLSLLVEVLALLKMPFHWTHFGDGELQEMVKKQAEKQIPGKFTLMGRVTNQEIITFLLTNPVDVLINVSLSEGIPVSIMEAMSFSIPVIATAVGGTPEIVNNNNGLLLSQNPTPEEIAHAITSFYNLISEQKELKRKAAYNTWDEKYNAEKNYSYFVKEILQL